MVPSTLPKKLKFLVEGQLVIVSGEEDILVSCPSSTPYVEDAEESLETSFQTLKIVNNAYVEVVVEAKLHDESRLIQRCIDDNKDDDKGDDKKLKGQSKNEFKIQEES